MDCVEGTCEWLLTQETFKEWINRPGGSLLISADPGCGKSVLAKYLIDEELPRVCKGSNICYYFFKDVVQDKLAPALCALLHQLYLADRYLLTCAIPTLKDNGTVITENVGLLLDLLLQAAYDCTDKSLVIVLDALDECDPEDCSRLLRFLERIQNSKQVGDKVKILLTTRPYDMILSRYNQNNMSNRLHVPGEEESDAISREIDLVIKYRLNKLCEKNRLSEELRLELEDRLLLEKNRTYLWVYLLFEELENGLKKTSRETRRLFKALPRNVNEAYEKILNKSDDEDIRQSVFQILCAIVSARRPLTVKELQCIAKIRLSPRTTSYNELDLESEGDFAIKMRNWCGLFIHVSKGRVSLIHQTAREFLTADIPHLVHPKISHLEWHGSIPVWKAHRIMTQLCVIYVSLCCQSVQQDLIFLTWQEVERIGGSFPFFSYVAQLWDFHLQRSDYAVDDDFLREVNLICSPGNKSFSFWYCSRDIPRRERTNYETGGGNNIVSYPQPTTDLDVAALLQSDILLEFLLAKSGYEPAPYRVAGALEFACYGHPNNAQLLLDCHSVDYFLLCGFPLKACVVLNRPDIAKEILSKTAEISDPELSAISRRNAVLAELLYPLNDDNGKEATERWAVDIYEKHTFSSVQYWQPVQRKVIWQLLEPPGNLERENSRGMTVLLRAAACGWLDAVKLLAKHGAKIDHQDVDGRTAMHHALMDKTVMTMCESWGIVVTLLHYGANPNIVAAVRGTVLIMAVSRDCPGLVQHLLEYRADPNLQDQEGYAPLHFARDKSIARMLLEYGADPDLQNKHGSSAVAISGWHGLTCGRLKILSSPPRTKQVSSDDGKPIMNQSKERTKSDPRQNDAGASRQANQGKPIRKKQSKAGKTAGKDSSKAKSGK